MIVDHCCWCPLINKILVSHSIARWMEKFFLLYGWLVEE